MWGCGNWFLPGISILPMEATGDMSDYQLACRIIAFMDVQKQLNQQTQQAITELQNKVAALESKVVKLQ